MLLALTHMAWQSQRLRCSRTLQSSALRAWGSRHRLRRVMGGACHYLRGSWCLSCVTLRGGLARLPWHSCRRFVRLYISGCMRVVHSEFKPVVVVSLHREDTATKKNQGGSRSGLGLNSPVIKDVKILTGPDVENYLFQLF